MVALGVWGVRGIFVVIVVVGIVEGVCILAVLLVDLDFHILLIHVTGVEYFVGLAAEALEAALLKVVRRSSRYSLRGLT